MSAVDRNNYYYYYYLCQTSKPDVILTCHSILCTKVQDVDFILLLISPDFTLDHSLSNN